MLNISLKFDYDKLRLLNIRWRRRGDFPDSCYILTLIDSSRRDIQSPYEIYGIIYVVGTIGGQPIVLLIPRFPDHLSVTVRLDYTPTCVVSFRDRQSVISRRYMSTRTAHTSSVRCFYRSCQF